MKEHPIRSIRIGKRLTQFEFSKILKINQAQLSSWETGAIPIHSHIVRRIAKVFKKDENELQKASDDFYETKRKKLRKYFEK
ncbi:hypothetical protein ES702_01381 [subsurface metagenome]